MIVRESWFVQALSWCGEQNKRIGENDVPVPEEKGSRMEIGWNHDQWLFSFRAFTYHILHCHCLVVLLPLQRLHGSAPKHSHQLSVFPLLLTPPPNILHRFIFYYCCKLQLQRIQTMTPTKPPLSFFM